MRGYDSHETALAALTYEELCLVAQLYFACEESNIEFVPFMRCALIAARKAVIGVTAEQLAKETMRLYQAGEGASA